MSATPNSAAPGWGSAPTPKPASETRQAEGHNALQALLAFACVHHQAERRRREAQGFADSSPRFSREEELALDEILQLVAARAIAITGADGVAIALAKDRAIVCRACAGDIAPDPGVRLDPNAGFSGACLRSGEIVRCDDSETDPRVNAQACRAMGARSMIAVPLSAKKRVIGLLEAFSSETFGFNDSDVRSLNLLGELILAAIRPEEEHHLAEMAREVLPQSAVKSKPEVIVPPPIVPTASGAVSAEKADRATRPAAGPTAPATPAVSASAAAEMAETVAPPASKILVDEKFAPAASALSARPAAEKAAAAIPTPILFAPTPSPAQVEPLPIGTQQTAAVAVGRTESQTLEDGVAVKHISIASPAISLSDDKVSVLEAPGSAVRDHRSLISISLWAAGVLLAIGLGGAVVWKYQHIGQPISANTQEAPRAQIPEGQDHDSASASPAPPLKIGAIAQVTGIHSSPGANISTVVVDLEDQVQYEQHSLDNPPRIYFDLHDTKLSPAFANQMLNVNDSFIKRIRVAQPMEGITRVVLETQKPADSEQPLVSLDANPYRLTIQFGKQAQSAPTSETTVKPQPMSKPSPAVSPTTGKPRASNAGPAPGDFEIALDAGHGGWDLGAVGKKGLLEKELVLDVVQRLGSLLESRLGANVVYTRQDDAFMSLEKRAEIANLAHADLFLSVHANYSDLSTARGVETYFTRTYSSVKARTPDVASVQPVNWGGVVDIRAKVKGAKLFASDIQQALYSGLAARNSNIRNRGVKEAEYVVLTGAQMPAVLAEVSYVSSPADEDRLQSSEYRQLIAEALYKGVVKYRQETLRMNVAKVNEGSQ